MTATNQPASFLVSIEITGTRLGAVAGRLARASRSLPRPRPATVVAALRRAHPYEEPAFHVVENAAQDC